MKDAIELIGINDADCGDCRVDVDSYVPLRFRTSERTIGAKYLRLGDFTHSLLEILLDPSSMCIRGFTLTLFDTWHEPKEIGVMSRSSGLPVVRLDRAFQGSMNAERVDLKKQFSVGLGSNFVEIDVDDIATAQSMISCGTAEFYVRSGYLVGLRVIELTGEQVALLRGSVIQP